MSSRDWQDGYEALEHPAEACTDTHELCVVVVHTAVRNKRTCECRSTRDIIGSSLSAPGPETWAWVRDNIIKICSIDRGSVRNLVS